MDVRAYLQPLIAKSQQLVDQAINIWLDGGWAMIAIATTAMLMFAIGLHMHLKLSGKGAFRIPERTWRRWVEDPKERWGPIGEIIDAVMSRSTIQEAAHVFQELRSTELAPFARDLRVMRICVSAAPLLGLLGTVTGMLATFGALSVGSGGDKTMDQIAAGISEALVTTETGLIIALPGLFYQYQLARKYERYRAFLSQLQTVCTQQIYRTTHREDATDPPDRGGGADAAPTPA